MDDIIIMNEDDSIQKYGLDFKFYIKKRATSSLEEHFRNL